MSDSQRADRLASELRFVRARVADISRVAYLNQRLDAEFHWPLEKKLDSIRAILQEIRESPDLLGEEFREWARKLPERD